MTEVEIWVMVDENGEYEVAKEAGDLQAEAGVATRMVRVTIKVPTPQPVEVEVEVSEEPDGATVSVN
jgi:hypothetical protein